METIDTTTAGVAEARQRVLREVGEAEIKFVRLWFTDLVGRLKSFAITRDELASALEHGRAAQGPGRRTPLLDVLPLYSGGAPRVHHDLPRPPARSRGVLG